jgi:hypothetical protein
MAVETRDETALGKKGANSNKKSARLLFLLTFAKDYDNIKSRGQEMAGNAMCADFALLLALDSATLLFVESEMALYPFTFSFFLFTLSLWSYNQFCMLFSFCYNFS